MTPTDGWMRRYRWVAGAAAAWAIANCAYVYFALNGRHAYRIESSAFIFCALLLPLIVVAPALSEPAIARVEGSGFSRTSAFVIAAAVAAWLAVVAPLATFPFLSDDYVFLGIYQHPADIPHRLQFFRPAFAAAFWLLQSAGGRSTLPFHLAAFALHLASAGLVFALARRIFGVPAPAVVAFVAFLLSPLQLEATLWISGLQELLWSSCVLAALWCYSRSQTLTASSLLATVLFAAMALLSKETAVSFILLLPLFDVVLYGFRRGRLLPIAYGAFVAVLVSYLLVRSRMTAALDGQFIQEPSRFFLKQFVAMPYRVFVQPWNASAIHVPDAVMFLTAAGAIALAAYAVCVRGVSRRILVGPAIVLATTAPLYGFFFVGANLASARYLYFPAAGWALICGGLMTGAFRTTRAIAAATIALAACLAVCLQLNLRPWTTAASIVRSLEETRHAMQDVAPVLEAWRLRLGRDLEMRDGVPASYQGVWIFLNGYPEFLTLTEQRR